MGCECQGTGEQEKIEKCALQLPSDESHRAISRRNGRLLETEADTTSKKPKTSRSPIREKSKSEDARPKIAAITQSHDRHLQSESVAKRVGEVRAKSDAVEAYRWPKVTRYCFQLKGFRAANSVKISR